MTGPTLANVANLQPDLDFLPGQAGNPVNGDRVDQFYQIRSSYWRRAAMFREERTKRFLEEHRVDEQKFADWSSAEAFFTAQGFEVTRKLAPSASRERIRETWTLSVRA